MPAFPLKKIFIHASVFVVCATLVSRVALAQTYGNPLNPTGAPGGGVNTIPEFLAMVLDGMSLLLIPLVVLFIIYAGYLFVTAQGEEGKIQKARTALLWTLVGAGVILGARIMATILKDTVDQLN